MEVVALGFCARTEIFHTEADTERAGGCQTQGSRMKMMERWQGTAQENAFHQALGHSRHPIPAGGIPALHGPTASALLWHQPALPCSPQALGKCDKTLPSH